MLMPDVALQRGPHGRLMAKVVDRWRSKLAVRKQVWLLSANKSDHSTLPECLGLDVVLLAAVIDWCSWFRGVPISLPSQIRTQHLRRFVKRWRKFALTQ
jgi:hypothetical protein